MRRPTAAAWTLAVVIVAAGCGSADGGAQASAPPTSSPTLEPSAEPTRSLVEDELYPVVIAAEADPVDEITWTVSVTMTSEYDRPERYADAWRVLDGAGNQLGIRVLTHDHANEQPFTRSVNVDIPADIETVFVEGRDQRNGWSGQRFELALPRD